MASSSNSRGKAKTSQPWTTTEDIALCKAWCEAMENYNVEDMRTGFWKVVFDNFQKEMGETIRGLKCQNTNNEIDLYKACVSESEDNIEGNGKKSSGFWTDLTEHCHKKIGEQKRSYDSVNCKWKDRIRPKVAPMGRDRAKKKASSSVARLKTSIAGDPSLVDVLLSKFTMAATSFFEEE
nr:hypothetical protein [Tanacetum cinerariifolium]